MPATESAERPRLSGPRPHHLVWLRTSLLVAWVIAVLLVPVVGERESRLSGLERDLASHAVTTVAVAGEGLAADETGSTIQTVHWRDGLIRRFAEVRVQQDADPDQTIDDEKIRTLRTRDAGTYLASYEHVSVTRTQDPISYGEVSGWRVPLPLSVLFLVVSVLALVMLVTGPEPWRATRWAWFWVWLTPTIGVPAYLLLGGPLALVPAPRNPGRRLTGGWAFILYLCLSRW